MEPKISNQDGWDYILSIYPDAFLYHEYPNGGFWFFKKPEDRDNGKSVFYTKNWKSNQFEFEEKNLATPHENGSFFTSYIGEDCYWWVPGTLNKDDDTDNPDLLSMVDFMFWDTGLELLFQEVVPAFDAFEVHVFTREQWYAIREIAKEKGGVWGRCLLETDAWADRTFKQYNEFTLRTV